MGKKRAISVRRLAERLIKNYPDVFTNDFEDNKRLVSEVVEFPFKNIRNEVAGYISRLKRIESTKPLQTMPTPSIHSNFSDSRRGRRRR